jgi:membrane fusion protein, copper/silver efflux system
MSTTKPPRGVRTMAVIRWALVALMAAAAFAAFNHRFGWIGGSGESAASAGTIYYCPMHPSVQQDHPGECPICSMTLVPKPVDNDPNAHEAAKATMEAGNRDASPVPGLAPVSLSQDRVQLMGLRTARVTREPLAAEVRTVGSVVASEKGLAVIQTRFAGWIEELHVEETGQTVRKGQVLASIYSPDLLTAQEEYLNALKWRDGSQTGEHASDLSANLHEDARRRLELLGISKPEIASIERTGKPMRAVAVRSPLSGTVTERGVVRGSYVQPGAPLFQLADLSRVWVLADVYEHEVARVKVGQAAALALAAYPGETFAGKVGFVYPSLDPATRTLRVRLELANPEGRLKPGLYGEVTIQTDRAEALVVPADAVVDTGSVQYVFVALPGGRFEPRRVTLAGRAGGKVQVLGGVAEGETVVTTANFLLDSESHLQAAILGEGAAGGTPAAPPGDFCETEIDKTKFPDKHQQCVACRAHRGMGSMEDDCRNQIARPWK